MSVMSSFGWHNYIMRYKKNSNEGVKMGKEKSDVCLTVESISKEFEHLENSLSIRTSISVMDYIELRPFLSVIRDRISSIEQILREINLEKEI